jgi:hypothetical protein
LTRSHTRMSPHKRRQKRGGAGVCAPTLVFPRVLHLHGGLEPYSEIRDTTFEAPIAFVPPANGLTLRPATLARSRVHVSLKLWRERRRRVWVKRGSAFLDFADKCFKLCLLCRRQARGTWSVIRIWRGRHGPNEWAAPDEKGCERI